METGRLSAPSFLHAADSSLRYESETGYKFIFFRQEYIFSLPPWRGCHSTAYPINSHGYLSFGIKWPEFEAKYSPPSKGEIWNSYPALCNCFNCRGYVASDGLRKWFRWVGRDLKGCVCGQSQGRSLLYRHGKGEGKVCLLDYFVIIATKVYVTLNL